ncbi:MAG: hypothetical protein M1819_004003 [Sarea resinae]|nr:MAG: hypothetical protein M1819_004003 [Sarea resinae]
MKHRFPFKLAPIRVPSPASIVRPRKSGDESPFILSSPTYEAPPPLSPQTERQLRNACALVLENFKPSDQLYEEICRSGLLNEDNVHGEAKSAREGWWTEPPTATAAKHQHKLSGPTGPTTYAAYRPSGHPENPFDDNAEIREDSGLNRSLSTGRGIRNKRPDPRQQAHVRGPPLSAGASFPHDSTAFGRGNETTKASVGQTDSYDTSTSSSRTNTTVDKDHSRSTGLTSAALTPAVKDKPFEPVLPRSEITATAWSERARVRRPSEERRPPTRASSLKENIQNYIKPRASKESLRSNHSGGSSRSAGSWWSHMGLSRRGSRSRGHQSKSERTGQQSPGAIDLNRPLPPLPGLDQWEENQQPKTHVANLMRDDAVGRAPAAIAHAYADEEPQEEQQRIEELRRAVEAKMTTGSVQRSASTTQKSGDERPRGRSGSAKVQPEISRKAVAPAQPVIEKTSERKAVHEKAVHEKASEQRPVNEKAGEKKGGGLRRKFSILGFGSKPERHHIRRDGVVN